MADEDIRRVLNIPSIVPSDDGDIEVREMSGIQVVQFADKLVVVGQQFRNDPDIDWTDGLSIGVNMMRKAPAQLFELIAPATNRNAEQLGNLRITICMTVLEKFIEHHREVIPRFFVLRRLVAAVLEDLKPSSPKRSTRSSVPGGATKTSETSPGINSNSSESEPAPATSGGNSTT